MDQGFAMLPPVLTWAGAGLWYGLRCLVLRPVCAYAPSTEVGCAGTRQQQQVLDLILQRLVRFPTSLRPYTIPGTDCMYEAPCLVVMCCTACGAWN
eukprot:3467821-Rhodomonas_salina.2